MKTMFLAAALAVSVTGADAQEDKSASKTAPIDSQRYELRKSEEGYLRLDRQTGAVSLCKVAQGGLVCRVGAREREAYVEALNSMQEQLDELRDRVDVLETHLALRDEEDAEEPQAQTGTGESDGKDGDDETVPGSELAEREIDRAVEFTRKAMRRLFEAVQDLKKDLEDEQPQ